MEFHDDLVGERTRAGNQDAPDDVRNGEPGRRERDASVEPEVEWLYRESSGGGAGRVAAQVVGVGALVCFLEGLEFPPHERFVIESRRGAQLTHAHHDFQQAMKQVSEPVERAVG